MITRWRLLAATLLLVLSTAVSLVLLLEHHGEARAVNAVSQVCGAGESGCATVARSPWSQIRGVPLAALGLAAAGSLAALLLLAAFASPDAQGGAGVVALLALGVALAVDVVLLAVQAFWIHAFCTLCLSTYVLNALALVLLLPAWRQRPMAGRGLRSLDGRLMSTGWLLATVALFAGVAATEIALDARERGRMMTMLGGTGPSAATSALATPMPLPSGDLATQLKAVQERAQALQDTIDNPQKLEQYYQEKAMREYEQATPQALDLKDVPVRGNPEAPIHTVEFSDFLCPFCRSLAGAFEGYLPQSAGRVAIHFKNYPLEQTCNTHVSRTVHPGACIVALGAVCANLQGKFWQYHDKVFSAPPQNPQADDVVRLGTEAGLDGNTLRACLDSGAAKDRLTREINEGATAGVNATPTVYLNGRKLPRLNDFIAMVDKEAARLGLPANPVPQPPRP
jgi:protein-disulfide isomerase/uncharacterized membrane protein